MWSFLALQPSASAAAFGPPACRRAPAPRMAATATSPAADWGGLPAAVKASKCGAINNLLVNAKDVEGVLKLVSDKDDQLNGVNVATALHQAARRTKFKRAERDALLRDPRYLKLVDSTIDRVAECNPRSVADVLWSCATLGELPPMLLKPVLTQVAKYLGTGSFEPQHLGIITWAFATLSCKPVKLLELIEQQALENLNGFNTQNCANILHGFAKLNYPATQLLPAISHSLLQSGLVAECKPVEVADLSYAVVMLGEPNPAATPPLLEQLAGRARASTDLERFSSRQLVTMVWAYARLGRRPDEGALAEWVAQVRAAHARSPLLAADVRNLERALDKLGEDASWLHPEPEPDEPEADADAPAA